MARAFSHDGLVRLNEVMASHVERDSAAGLAWLVARRGEVHTGVEGALTAGSGIPMACDSIFRISSMTKPVTAAAAMILVEECVVRLDDPVDDLLPELAGRRVLARADGPLDDTVPAERPITLRDLLTFRLGLGMDFSAPFPQATLDAMADLDLGVGPPRPAGVPAPDEWMRRLGSVPLAHQPGSRWLYHTSADVLGVLVARAAGQPFEVFLREQLLAPLGMSDTGFSVPPVDRPRFGATHTTDPVSGERGVFDPPDGDWSAPPAFPGGGAGLVSTLEDYHAFATMLLAHGTHRGQRILSRSSVQAMTANHLTPEQLVTSGPGAPTGARGWGFGMSVQLARTGPAGSVGAYGWDGGLGTSWMNDPAEDLVGVLLTNEAWPSPDRPPVCQDFWTCAYAAVED
ncbi:MAG TPA: serine hydrolase domain-containing protein [Acidimicrobiales bacterium]